MAVIGAKCVRIEPRWQALPVVLGYIISVDPAQAPISFAGYTPEAMGC
jgi:hypothetical protein